jgi:hypothetical protein
MRILRTKSTDHSCQAEEWWSPTPGYRFPLLQNENCMDLDFDMGPEFFFLPQTIPIFT